VLGNLLQQQVDDASKDFSQVYPQADFFETPEKIFRDADEQSSTQKHTNSHVKTLQITNHPP
jgi:hypothetical protein